LKILFKFKKKELYFYGSSNAPKTQSKIEGFGLKSVAVTTKIHSQATSGYRCLDSKTRK
jgi:hypothetical protein